METVIITCLKKARKQGILIRFTLGLKLLLAIAFIPTGAVKLLGRRFTTGVPEDDSPLLLFEALYQSGVYWQFLGAVQILAGCLLLFYRTSAIGALLFLAIASNILFITISYDFGLTIFVSSGITLASLWLVFWHWDSIRFLFLKNVSNQPILLDKPVLKSKVERIVFTTGFLSGLVLFSILRGLEMPIFMVYISILISVFCFVFAIILSIIDYMKGAKP
ncbi:MAG: DoxX family protein [Bacteroidetes bacterium]|nr:DoxX family protein [Bacteroidota bacterium]